MRELTLNAKMMFIDFEGRSDGESIRKLLANIKPKNLVRIFSANLSEHLEMEEKNNQFFLAFCCLDHCPWKGETD